MERSVKNTGGLKLVLHGNNLSSASAVAYNIYLSFGPRGESLTTQRIIKDKQINHGNHHDESKTRTHRISKQFNPGGTRNRQEAPAPTN